MDQAPRMGVGPDPLSISGPANRGSRYGDRSSCSGEICRALGKKGRETTDQGHLEKCMASEEHLQIIRQGVDAWNEWRKKNPKLIPDLSGTDLSFASLSGANFGGVNLSGANLSGANFYEAHLITAHLDGANLSGADLSATRLGGANLGG